MVMDRQNKALGVVMGLIPCAIAGVNLFEPDKFAQSCVMATYAVLVFGIMRWGTRRTA
jgi:hypothetical protein